MALFLRTLFKPNHNIVKHFSKIAITDDGSTIVAIHRDTDFPYNYSKPLPEEVQDTSVLKMSDIEEVKRVFYEMSPEIAKQQLCNLTLTTKHRWFPRARDKRSKRTEMNRPYL